MFLPCCRSIVGLGESQGDRKKRRERKRPLAELDSGQVLPQQSLQVCVCMHVCVCVYVCARVCVCARACTCTCTVFVMDGAFSDDMNLFFFQNLARVALKCLCELLLSLPHFNFCNNILTVLVPRMNSKALGGEVYTVIFLSTLWVLLNIFCSIRYQSSAVRQLKLSLIMTLLEKYHLRLAEAVLLHEYSTSSKKFGMKIIILLELCRIFRG